MKSMDSTSTEYELLAEAQAGEDESKHLKEQTWFNRREGDSVLTFVSALPVPCFG